MLSVVFHRVLFLLFTLLPGMSQATLLSDRDVRAWEHDYNSDGVPDIVVYASPRVVFVPYEIELTISPPVSYVLYGQADGSFGTPETIAPISDISGAQALEVFHGKFIADENELFIRSNHTGVNGVVLGGLERGSPSIELQFSEISGIDISTQNNRFMAVGDENNDGWTDVIIREIGFYDQVAINEAGNFSSIVDTTPRYRVENYNPHADVPVEAALVGATANSGVSVNASGAAQYSVPIQIPPGVKGLQPNLSFVYNSQAGNGLLGRGWNLAGLSAISRCRSTIAQDGFVDAIDFDDNDRFCLDGQRLVVSNGGSYGDSNTQYRTEIDQYSRITSLNATRRVHAPMQEDVIVEGISVYEPGFFKVEQKSGLILEYGSTADSKIEAQGQMLAHQWLLNKVSDRNGNFYTLTYEEDNANGDYRISKIEYGFNSTENTSTPLAKVEFGYGEENRPDILERYFAGSVQRTMKLLRSVTTYSHVESSLAKVRSYNLGYEVSIVGSSSELQYIQECDGGIPAENSCLPALEFSWQLESVQSENSRLTNFSTVMSVENRAGSTDVTRIKQGDFNGDGRTDIYYQGMFEGTGPNDTIYFSNPDGGFSSYVTSYRTVNYGHTMNNVGGTPNGGLLRINIGDFDGNGLADVYRIVGHVDVEDWQHRDKRSDVQPDIIEYSFVDSNGHFYTTSVRTSFSTSISLLWDNYTAGETNDFRRFMFGDYNGDGLTDLLMLRGYSSSATPIMYLAIPGDIENNNLGQFAEVESNVSIYFTGPDGSWPASMFSTSRFRTADINGDGLTDLMKFPDRGGEQATIYYSSGDGNFVTSTFVLPSAIRDSSYESGFAHSYFDLSRYKFCDLNGDGKQDIFVFAREGESNHQVMFSTGATGANAFVLSNLTFPDVGHSPITSGNLEAVNLEYSRYKFSDINGDGKTDLYKFVSSGPDDIAKEGVPDEIYLSNGDGSFSVLLTDYSTYISPDTTDAKIDLNRAVFIDLNGDGVKDFYWNNGDTVSGELQPDTYYLSNGAQGNKVESFTDSLGVSSTIQYSSLHDLDLSRWSNYGERPIAGQYPYRANIPSFKVVSSVERSNGDGGTNIVDYLYRGYLVDVTGRGSLGFQLTVEESRASNVVKMTNYNQLFPYTGTVKSEFVTYGTGVCLGDGKYCQGGSVINLSENEWVNTEYYNGVYQRYIEQNYVLKGVLDDDYEYGGDVGSGIGSSTSWSPVDQYGNHETITKTVSELTTVEQRQYETDASNWLLNKLTSLTITNQLDSDESTTRINSTSFTYDSLTGQMSSKVIEPEAVTSFDRLVTTYTYDEYGNLEAQVDCTGMSAIVDCVESEVTARVKKYEYDAYGRFLESTRLLSEPDGQTETYLRNGFLTDARFGVVNSITDEREHTTEIVLDSLGRPLETLFPDGTKTRISRSWCNQNTHCPEVDGRKGFIKVSSISSGQGPVAEYFDQFGRKYRDESVGFDGRLIFTDTQYDRLGRADKVSQPYFEGESNVVWNEYEYDNLNRLQVSRFVDAEGNAQTESYDYRIWGYKDYTDRVTDALGNTTLTVKNDLSQVVERVDAKGNYIRYTYDASGNLTSTKLNDNSATLITMGYDVRDRKTTMQDPDMGSWTYVYDSFGDMRKTTSVRETEDDIVTNMSYDRLGRKYYETARTNSPFAATDTKTWVYSRTPGKDAGLLIATDSFQAGRYHSKAFSYDDYSRVRSTTYTTDDRSYAATLEQTYDEFGRLQTIQYPTWISLTHYYNEHGYLTSVNQSDLNQPMRPGEPVWMAEQMNARQQLEVARLGNEVVETNTYSHYTGALEGIDVSPATGPDFHQLAYTYTAVGNVHTRTDVLQGLTETFDYDELNRIESITPSGGESDLPLQRFAYDDLGNVTDKHGIGSYEYGTCFAGPHAVCAAGTKEYQYDEAGNLRQTFDTSTSQLTDVLYTPSNLPWLIGTTRLYYDADNNRVKQDFVNQNGELASTYYLGNGAEGGTLFERTVTGAVTEDKHFIYALGAEPVAVLTRSTNAAEKLEYFHRDALGSVVAMTNQTGALAMTMSHDLFGQRRNTDLSAANDPSLLPRVAGNEGYTGHEELPDLGLIHMNGRVYDPRIGRFLSADPNIPDPFNTQSYNRYSYVMNNPMNWVDPSGFFGLCVEFADYNYCPPDGSDTEFPDTLTFTQNSQFNEFRGFDTTLNMGGPEAGLNSGVDMVVSLVPVVSAGEAAAGIVDAVNDLFEKGVSTDTLIPAGVKILSAIMPGKSEKALEGVLDVTKSVKPGEFNIIDWKGYPAGVPKPSGPVRLVEGAEYDAARKAANSANNNIRQQNNLRGQPVDVHEIQPVKFGGSATDPANKIILDRSTHRQEVTPWWNQLQKDVGG